MLPKGKSRIEAILLKLKDSKDTAHAPPDEGEPQDEVPVSGRITAMEEFITAVKKGDAEAADEALCSFLHMHEDCEECEGDASEEEMP